MSRGKAVHPVDIVINRRQIREVMIDDHYKKKHRKSINDQIILELVKQLDGKEFRRVGQLETYEYFVNDPIFYKNKPYRLIWLLEKRQNYIGIVNAFRRRIR